MVPWFEFVLKMLPSLPVDRERTNLLARVFEELVQAGAITAAVRFSSRLHRPSPLPLRFLMMRIDNNFADQPLYKAPEHNSINILDVSRQRKKKSIQELDSIRWSQVVPDSIISGLIDCGASFVSKTQEKAISDKRGYICSMGWLWGAYPRPYQTHWAFGEYLLEHTNDFLLRNSMALLELSELYQESSIEDLRFECLDIWNESVDLRSDSVEATMRHRHLLLQEPICSHPSCKPHGRANVINIKLLLTGNFQLFVDLVLRPAQIRDNKRRFLRASGGDQCLFESLDLINKTFKRGDTGKESLEPGRKRVSNLKG